MKNSFAIPEYINVFFDKYKYPLVVFVLGVVLVIFSGNSKDGEDIRTYMETDYGEKMEVQIKNALEKIDGVGKAEVILSLKNSEQNIYAKEGDEQTEIVMVNENGTQKALVEYTESPVYKGALIVCDGGDNSRVRLEITEAVKALTGINSKNIIISKMKK